MKVLKFGAVWCPGCIVMRPRWQKIEKDNPWLKTEYFDADESAELVEEWQVKSLPSFIFLDKSGKELTRLVGEISEERIMTEIDKFKNS